MTGRPDVDRILAVNRYLVLATADERGLPWASPVFFARLGANRLCWVSAPERRHSRNLERRTEVAVTVFDSTVEVGKAEAVYADTEARPASADETDAALGALNARLPAGKHLVPADLIPTGSLVVYVADVRHWYLLVRGGDAEFGNDVDMTVEV